jgi:6-bladed beta-propeller
MNRPLRIAVSAVGAVVLIAVVGRLAGRAGDDARRVAIEETLSIGTVSDDLIYQLTGVAVDSEGFIYVLDGMDYALKKFDTEGRLVGKTGRKGQGPGEFLAPRLLESAGSRIFATDQYRLGIQVFDRDLTFKTVIPCRSVVQALKAITADKIAVMTMSTTGSAGLEVLNMAGEVLSEFPFADKASGWLMDSACFASLPDGSFAVAYIFKDRVERWTADGRRLWSGAYLAAKRSPMAKVDSPIGTLTLPSETCYNDIAADSGGRIFVLAGRLAKNPARDVFVLDGDGRLQATFTLPQSSHCLVLDAKNQLYVRANDGITLKKYRVRYE